MALVKANGNMYGWVTHMHTHLRGPCPHQCVYCYARLPARGHPSQQSGPLRFLQEELTVRYGNGKVIFVDHKNDLWADAIPLDWQRAVLSHCCRWPLNEYVFQTKNPSGYHRFLSADGQIPPLAFLGATIETNRPDVLVSLAPPPLERAAFMCGIRCRPKFVTVEPVMRFDLGRLVDLICSVTPEFVNLGADSKGNYLPEPTAGEISALIRELRTCKIELRLKNNLRRILGPFCRTCGATREECTHWQTDVLCADCAARKGAE